MLCMEDLVQFRVDIPPGTKKTFDAAAKAHGLNYRVAAGRLLDWFNGQKPEIQAMVLGLVPESIRPDAARAIMQIMAGDAPNLKITEQHFEPGGAPQPNSESSNAAAKKLKGKNTGKPASTKGADDGKTGN